MKMKWCDESNGTAALSVKKKNKMNEMNESMKMKWCDETNKISGVNTSQ